MALDPIKMCCAFEEQMNDPSQLLSITYNPDILNVLVFNPILFSKYLKPAKVSKPTIVTPMVAYRKLVLYEGWLL